MIIISDILKDLNMEQRASVLKMNGPLLIVAGAGTGKTKVLVSRTAYMLEKGIQPSSILLLTFTNKAAKEMKNRICNKIGLRGRDITACTFHSFCANLLRKYISDFFDISNNFSILDNTDSNDAISIVRQEFLEEKKKSGIKYELKDFISAKKLQYIYETSIDSCVDLEDILLKETSNKYRNESKIILDRYIEYKKEHNMLDYSDLLNYVYIILNNNKDFRHYLDEKYKYIMCDEYQDTNIIQARILELLSLDNNNLAVVGDDNQSIYSFRGANVDNILRFEEKNHAEKIILKENYRSTQEILDFSNAVMSYAKEGIPKTLCGQFHGLRPRLITVNDTFFQNKNIIDSIERKKIQGTKYKDMAVIVRSSVQTNYLELELTKHNIPYEKFGGLKFFEHSSVKDILAFIKIINNYKDEISWYRILQHYPGIGNGFANKISKSIAEHGIIILNTLYSKRKFASYLHEISLLFQKLQTVEFNKQIDYLISNYYFKLRTREINASDIDDIKKADLFRMLDKDMEDLMFLLNISKKYKDVNSFLNDITLDATSPDKKGDFLNITTIHSAKGLEYDVVFLPDIIEEVTPTCPPDSSNDSEELRCFYVAITRAKKELFLYVPLFSTSTYKRILGKKSHFINHDDIIETLQEIRL